MSELLDNIDADIAEARSLEGYYRSRNRLCRSDRMVIGAGIAALVAGALSFGLTFYVGEVSAPGNCPAAQAPSATAGAQKAC